MFVLVVSASMAVGAAWLLIQSSGALLMLVYVGAGAVVAARLALAASTRRLPSSAVWSLILALAPLAWYVGNAIGADMPQASSRHAGEMLGAVLPGIVLGLAAGLTVAQLLAQPREAAWALQRRIGWVVAATSGGAWLLAAFLLQRTRDDMLLVSAELLEGAETYQTLGDALSTHLVLAWMLLGLAAARSGRALPTLQRLLALPALTLALAVAAVLTGSNKLLLIVGAVLLVLLGGRLWADRRRPARLAAALLLLVGGAALAARLLGAEVDFGDLLAATRLLDYGGVDSILDTPSVASRLELFTGCGAQQFALAPITGDLGAEFKTCGDGHYVHSLASIQTHLGLVGTLLFGAAVGRSLALIAGRRDYRPLAGPYALVLGTGLIAAHFTWMPFWFLLALGATLHSAASRSSAQTVDPSSQAPALRA